MKNRQVITDPELNAILDLDESFRFLVSKDDLDEYDKGFVNWHKQPTIEISVVCEGAVNVYVLEQEITVSAGDGFFIMPGYLHSIRPTPQAEAAKYFTLIFHPEILYGTHGSYYEKSFYLPFLNSNTPYYTFSNKDIWTEPIFAKLKEIAEQYPNTSPEFYLQTQHTLQDVWVSFSKNLTLQAKPEHTARNNRKILELIHFLHEHYQEKFSLTAMAEHVSMSRNECCRYFKRMMNMTIMEYLLEYRLAVAKNLLETTDLSITAVSEQAGFCDVSYFIKIFHQKTGMTPKAYVTLLLSHHV